MSEKQFRCSSFFHAVLLTANADLDLMLIFLLDPRIELSADNSWDVRMSARIIPCELHRVFEVAKLA